MAFETAGEKTKQLIKVHNLYQVHAAEHLQVSTGAFSQMLAGKARGLTEAEATKLDQWVQSQVSDYTPGSIEHWWSEQRQQAVNALDNDTAAQPTPTISAVPDHLPQGSNDTPLVESPVAPKPNFPLAWFAIAAVLLVAVGVVIAVNLTGRPDSSASPETTAPETTAPETTAPETTAPETEEVEVATTTPPVAALAGPVACDVVDIRSENPVPETVACGPLELTVTGNLAFIGDEATGLQPGWNRNASSFELDGGLSVTAKWENWDDGTPKPDGVEELTESRQFADTEDPNDRFQAFTITILDPMKPGSLTVWQNEIGDGQSVTFNFNPEA